MKELKISSGHTILVDDDDYELVASKTWKVRKGYAVRNQRSKGKRHMISMHRFIINPPSNMQVDHINGNKLDNRRCNLRVCTVSQNQANRDVSRNNTSGYKGVDVRNGKFRVRIGIKGRRLHLGLFDTLEDARLAYKDAAERYHGEFVHSSIKD